MPITREELQAKILEWHEVDMELSSEYEPIGKLMHVGPTLRKLSEEGKLGEVVLSLGEGRKGLTKFLDEGKHRVIAVDLLGAFETEADTLHITVDIETIIDYLEIRRKVIKMIREFLDVPECTKGTDEEREQIDTVILSDILNYIDYQRVLLEVNEYVRTGGRLIIYNEIDRTGIGRENLMSEKRPRNNIEIINCLMALGYEIEIMQECEKRDFTTDPEAPPKLFIDGEETEVDNSITRYDCPPWYKTGQQVKVRNITLSPDDISSTDKNPIFIVARKKHKTPRAQI